MQAKRSATKPKDMSRKPVFSAKKIIFYVEDGWIGAVEAAKIAGVSRQMIHIWCTKNGIGKKIGRNFRVDPEKLKEFINKDTRPYLSSNVAVEKGVKNYKCPYDHKFGIDYDEKEKCAKCNQIVWLHCGRKNERIFFAKQAILKSEKLYTKSELKKKITEMEKRL